MTEKKWCLYKHTSPSGKVYVGITSKPVKRRWNNGLGYQPCRAFWKAIVKYGWDNIQHEIILDQLSEQAAKELEIILIKHYKELGISYNITNGGDGYLGFNPSLETRRKISDAMKGRTHVCTEETRRHLSEIRLAKFSKNSVYQSQEFRDKISKAVEYKKVRVVQLGLDGTFIASFSSANEAQKHTGVDRGAILRCCKGKVKRAGNFIWTYYE